VELVQKAIDEISAFHDVSSEEAVAAVGPKELATRTGLTEHLVESSLRRIGLSRKLRHS
jgi:hypothetical protein